MVEVPVYGPGERNRADKPAEGQPREYLVKPATAEKVPVAYAWAELGLVYLRQRDYEEARRALDRALALDPDGYLPNLNVLILYQRTKDPRADAQSQRFEKIKTQRSENEKLLMRMIEVRPY